MQLGKPTEPYTPVILESPYAGDVEKHLNYARRCMLDCLLRNEAPFLSHLLYTQVLDDTDPDHRAAGIAAGQTWTSLAKKVVVYIDHGISRGMKIGIQTATQNGVPVELRNLSGEPIRVDYQQAE
jgi:hypothetical protein